jgi:hypothetical protein
MNAEQRIEARDDRAAAIKALRERVEAATGPDRELDRDLCEMLGDHNEFLDCPQIGSLYGISALTRSLDAAFALIEHCVPGSHGRVEPRFFEENEVRWRGYIIRPDWAKWNPVDDDWFEVHQAMAATPPLAIVLALLTALEAHQ